MSNIADTLIEAGLLNEVQVQVALHDQTINPEMRMSEILSLRGWVSEETVDFFELLWEMRQQQPERQKIGQYFVEARLITDAQVDDVLAEQRVSPLRFGEIAILKGYVKQETVSFFVKHLFPDKLEVAKISPLARAAKSNQNSRQNVINNNLLQQVEESAEPKTSNHQNRQRRNPQGKRPVPPPPAPKNRGLLNRIKRQVQDKILLTNSTKESPLIQQDELKLKDTYSSHFDVEDANDNDLNQL